MLSKFEAHHRMIRQNRWYWYFYILCRLSLAFGFFAAGMVKIVGERFASGLSIVHPMGAYLEALHHTGYYYTFIGVAQILAAVLLIIPRTVTLGALVYLPIIVNIWILSFAVRFDGSYMTAPLMTFANIYILVWNYDRLKYILPLKIVPSYNLIQKPAKWNNRFPFLFFSGVALVFVIVVLRFALFHDIMPRNSVKDCRQQFIGKDNQKAGFEFCDCIHNQGGSLDHCLELLED
ncbi:DoxX family protein [Subsaxibacter sp. CAU 1640]|uniref:DoxX family protein n=1 Tax=Subsaxibacter sp. CAU 1640 TaxID=2933271 RepID=UPI0020058B18|nr:DoxX family protein [Subsaxibacter sp. CAU 1640]MCK7590626.1 DoxX family protein [Subsaxibacter sp. CAU 1640]